MVRQRFLTHFKPWLSMVIKVGGVIIGYQLFDHIRRYFQYAPLNIVDVVTAATLTLLVIGFLCGMWVWGEWCWSKLRMLRTFGSKLKRAFHKVRRRRAVATDEAVRGRMV